MLISLRKFGNILTSREAGREALLAFSPMLESLKSNEEIIIDFQGVSVLTPSWADEFIRPILFLKKYAKKVSVINDTNPSVQAALRFASPRLDLTKITVYKDSIVFHEVTDAKIYDNDRNQALLLLTFPYSDEEALLILKNNNVEKISVSPADHLAAGRLEDVVDMFSKAGIQTQFTRFGIATFAFYSLKSVSV